MEKRPYSVFVRSRPARTGFLIDVGVFSPGSDRFEDLVDEVIRHNYLLWGGRLNPIIFFAGDSLTGDQWKQLETVDVDCVKSFSPLPKSLVNQLDERLQPLDIEIKVLAPDAPIHVESHGVVTPPTAENLGGFGEAKFLMFEFTLGCERLLQRFCHRNFGTYWQWIQHGTSHVRRDGLLERLLAGVNVERVQISDRASLATALSLLAGTPPGAGYRVPLKFIAPARLPSLYLPEVWPQMDGIYQVIVGEAPSDLGQFWNGILWNRNWTAPYSHQLWIPKSLAEDPVLRDSLRNWLSRYTGVGNSDAISVEFTSTTVPPVDLETLRQSICNGGPWSPRGHVAEPSAISDRISKAETDFYSVRPGLLLGSTEDAVRYSAGHAEEIFALTKPRGMVEEINPDGVWMADVQLELVSPNSLRDQGWWLAPRLHSGGLLSHMFRAGARVNRHGTFSIRVESQSGPYSRGVKPEVKFRLPELTHVVPLLIEHPRNQCMVTTDPRYEDRFRQSGIRVRASDKGEYLRGLIHVFGGFGAAKEYCERRLWRRMFAKLANYDARNDSRIREDIANLLKKRQAHDGPEYLAGRVLGLVRGQAKRALALPYAVFKEELDELAGTPPPKELSYPQGDAIVCHQGIEHLSEEEMKEGLDHLVDLDVLRMGVYVRCEYCGIRPWYLVDDLKQRVRCPGCGHERSIGAHQEWSYSLNSLAEMAVVQGQLGVMQALAALASNSWHSFLYSPSLDLFKAGSTDRWHEIDIPAVADGDFVVGEVKGGERAVTERDFLELAEIAEALRPQRAMMFLLNENVTREVMACLEKMEARLKPLGIRSQIFALPSF